PNRGSSDRGRTGRLGRAPPPSWRGKLSGQIVRGRPSLRKVFCKARPQMAGRLRAMLADNGVTVNAESLGGKVIALSSPRHAAALFFLRDRTTRVQSQDRRSAIDRRRRSRRFMDGDLAAHGGEVAGQQRPELLRARDDRRSAESIRQDEWNDCAIAGPERAAGRDTAGA